MLQKTKGIVLNYLKYRESSIIIRIYTKEFGIQTYIENGIRAKKSKNKIAFFQPLTMLDLVVYYQKNKPNKLSRISELKCYYPYKHIPFEFKKQSIMFFMTEVLVKTLKEEVGNDELYGFLENSFIFFDTQTEKYNSFHIYFLIKLAGFLGFAFEKGEDFFAEIETYKHIIIEEKIKKCILDNLNFCVNNNSQTTDIPHKQYRTETLNLLLDFYRFHIENFGELKSLEVLKEIMNE